MSGEEKTPYHDEAIRMVKRMMVERDIKNPTALLEILREVGLQNSLNPLSKKLREGTYPMWWFLAVASAIGMDRVEIDVSSLAVPSREIFGTKKSAGHGGVREGIGRPKKDQK